MRNGKPLAGATGPSFHAAGVGSYSCRSTASNQAGSSAQTSASVAIFRIGKAKLDKEKGTATLPVKVPGAGAVTLSGKSIVRRKRSRSGSSTGVVKLLIKAKGKCAKTLTEKGKLRVKATVRFLPTGGRRRARRRRWC